MIKTALTGNIASGKSAVQDFIEQAGYKVFCTDECAHKILENNVDVKKLFGTNERTKIAQIVFKDKNKLKALESIIHPIVKEELEAFFYANRDEKLVFAAVPQLYEAGFENMFDKVILIRAPYNVRLERLIMRNGYDANYAKLRLDSQMSEEEKALKSDIIIDNNSSFEDLKNKTTEALKLLL